jgi:hypothetical protein
MTVRLLEQYDSRSATTSNTSSSAELHYVMTGTADALEVNALVASSTPGTYGNLVRGDWNIEPVHVDSTNPDACIWDVKVKYVPPTDPKATTEDPATFNFDTGGGTQHIVASKQTVAAYGTGATTGDNGNLIGVTKDNVEGVDVTIPVYSFSETHYFDDSVVTDAYKGKLYALTGKTNNGTFKGCAVGECLFLGASGSKRSGEKWEITFKFSASPNKTGIMVGDKGPINKKGWEYLWVRYAPTVIGGLKVMGQKPVAVYVEKVYDDGNFGDLGIGT